MMPASRTQQVENGPGCMRCSNILVPVDLDDQASWHQAVPTALVLARCFGSRVYLLYVVPDAVLAIEAQWSGLALRRILDTAEARLGLLAEELCGDSRIEVRVATGKVHLGVLDVAERERADLIVLASHKPTTRDFLLGENAERIVRHASCSVFVVRS